MLNMEKSASRSKTLLLVISNLAMHVMWARVLLVFLDNGFSYYNNNKSQDNSSSIFSSSSYCETELRPKLIHALIVSSIELLNAMLGLTRSNPIQVLLFASVRTGVEMIAAPLLPCNSWLHLWTAFCWSLGEIFRFGCFAVDSMLSFNTTKTKTSLSLSNIVKTVRYTVGPILFPCGALGEMLMVIRIAMDGRPLVFIAAALWPVGFYPLMVQLLKQRKKHIQSCATSKKTT